VNRAKIGVKKSVIRLDDFSVVAHEKAPDRLFDFIRVMMVKKDVDHDVYDRWRME
jgi:hypothetical protein